MDLEVDNLIFEKRFNFWIYSFLNIIIDVEKA